MDKFTESIHCTSRLHCEKCQTDAKWRQSILYGLEWDGVCPVHHTLHTIPKPTPSPKMDFSKFDLAKEQGVLSRMISRGCKSCEIKRQQRLVQSLLHRIDVTWTDYELLISKLVKKIEKSGDKFTSVVGIPRGGLIPAVSLSHRLKIPLLDSPTGDSLIVDDILLKGTTIKAFNYTEYKIAVLYKSQQPDVTPTFWADEVKTRDQIHGVIFPWERFTETEHVVS